MSEHELCCCCIDCDKESSNTSTRKYVYSKKCVCKAESHLASIKMQGNTESEKTSSLSVKQNSEEDLFNSSLDLDSDSNSNLFRNTSTDTPFGDDDDIDDLFFSSSNMLQGETDVFAPDSELDPAWSTFTVSTTSSNTSHPAKRRSDRHSSMDSIPEEDPLESFEESNSKKFCVCNSIEDLPTATVNEDESQQQSDASESQDTFASSSTTPSSRPKLKTYDSFEPPSTLGKADAFDLFPAESTDNFKAEFKMPEIPKAVPKASSAKRPRPKLKKYNSFEPKSIVGKVGSHALFSPEPTDDFKWDANIPKIPESPSQSKLKSSQSFDPQSCAGFEDAFGSFTPQFTIANKRDSNPTSIERSTFGTPILKSWDSFEPQSTFGTEDAFDLFSPEPTDAPPTEKELFENTPQKPHTTDCSKMFIKSPTVDEKFKFSDSFEPPSTDENEDAPTSTSPSNDAKHLESTDPFASISPGSCTSFPNVSSQKADDESTLTNIETEVPPAEENISHSTSKSLASDKCLSSEKDLLTHSTITDEKDSTAVDKKYLNDTQVDISILSPCCSRHCCCFLFM